MILGSLFRRAENAVENILDQALARILVAVPLLVAAGFATAAASGYLNARYGSEVGNLIMAGGFLVVALFAGGYVAARSSQQTNGASEAKIDTTGSETADATSSDPQQAQALSDSERELFNSVLASAAPIALPALLRLLLRNIPLLLALALAGYVLSRQFETPAAAETAAS